MQDKLKDYEEEIQYYKDQNAQLERDELRNLKENRDWYEEQCQSFND